MPGSKLDFWLVIPVLLLSILGLLVLTSIAPGQLSNQSIFLLISIIVFFIFAHTDYKIFFSLHAITYITSIIFILLPYFFGLQSRGAIRWLQFGSISIQPSEVTKAFLLITFSVLAASTSSKKYLFLFLSFILPGLLIFLQPDLGTTLVLGVGWVSILASKISLRSLIVLTFTVCLLLPLGWLILLPYQKQRIYTFINPYTDPLGSGYHVIQSITAVGSGQITGRGLGHGTQSQLRFLPEHYTDFVFASLSEELGFLGATLVFLLYLIFLYRIYRISQTTSSAPAAFYCLSLLSMLTFQIFVNIGMNMGIAPITGITLPFLSYGGSSLLSLGILLGILSNISSSSKARQL